MGSTMLTHLLKKRLSTSNWFFLSSKSFASKAPSLCIPPRLLDSGQDIRDLRDNLAQIVGAQKAFNESFNNRESLLGLLPKSQSELQPKSISGGLQVAWLRLSDEKVREKYISFLLNVRFGRILEDLDTFAVWTSYMHNKPVDDTGGDFQSPLVIVTAMVDQIDLKQSLIRADSDLRFIGYVSWVGKTSMEVTMQLQQQQDPTQPLSTAVEARFLMVARDPLNRGSAFVAPLRPEGPEEDAIFAQGEKHKITRQQEAKESLLKESPSPDESRLIHQMFLETLDTKSNKFSARVKPESAVWMESTLLKNVLINHPQNRNLYNKIFGGYLMRQAYELAWSNAVRYCKVRPVPFSVDDIVFQRPVEIGTLLFLSSQVVFTKDFYMQVRVHAEVLIPTETRGETTNVFHFTFATPDEGPVPEVMPKTYAEYMMFLDGKRHFESVVTPKA